MSSLARLEGPSARLAEVQSGVWRSAQRRAKNETATFALHDAKNMVCALQNGLEWLRARKAPLDVESAGAIDEMAETCHALSRLLLDALHSTSTGQTELRVQRKPVSVAKLVQSVARRIRARAGRQGVTVIVEKSTDAVASLDAPLLARVVENLVDNALRVSPAGSSLTLSCGRFGDNAVIAVTDQGPGVDPGLEQEIFELYATDGQNDGTGIGLAFCRRVIDAHGGHLTLDSRPGEGASFVMCLPIRDE